MIRTAFLGFDIIRSSNFLLGEDKRIHIVPDNVSRGILDGNEQYYLLFDVVIYISPEEHEKILSGDYEIDETMDVDYIKKVLEERLRLAYIKRYKKDKKTGRRVPVKKKTGRRAMFRQEYEAAIMVLRKIDPDNEYVQKFKMGEFPEFSAGRVDIGRSLEDPGFRSAQGLEGFKMEILGSGSKEYEEPHQRLSYKRGGGIRAQQIAGLPIIRSVVNQEEKNIKSALNKKIREYFYGLDGEYLQIMLSDVKYGVFPTDAEFTTGLYKNQFEGFSTAKGERVIRPDLHFQKEGALNPIVKIRPEFLPGHEEYEKKYKKYTSPNVFFDPDPNLNDRAIFSYVAINLNPLIDKMANDIVEDIKNRDYGFEYSIPNKYIYSKKLYKELIKYYNPIKAISGVDDIGKVKQQFDEFMSSIPEKLSNIITVRSYHYIGNEGEVDDAAWNYFIESSMEDVIFRTPLHGFKTGINKIDKEFNTGYYSGNDILDDAVKMHKKIGSDIAVINFEREKENRIERNNFARHFYFVIREALEKAAEMLHEDGPLIKGVDKFIGSAIENMYDGNFTFLDDGTIRLGYYSKFGGLERQRKPNKRIEDIKDDILGIEIYDEDDIDDELESTEREMEEDPQEIEADDIEILSILDDDDDELDPEEI